MDFDPATLPKGQEINPLAFPNDVNIDAWMFDVIKPYIKGRTLEIGSGNDNIISCFFNKDLPLHLSNIDRENCRLLFEKYKTNPLVRSVRRIDLGRVEFNIVHADLIGKFLTVVKLNPLYARSINELELAHAHLLLREGGYLIVLIPAYTASYDRIEHDIDLIRMSNRSYVRRLIGPLFEIRKTQYLNLPPLSNGMQGQSGLSAIIVAQKV